MCQVCTSDVTVDTLGSAPLMCARHEQVADFGLSQTGVTDGLSAMISKPGTAAFAAPELLRTGSLAAESDVYSFGVVAWHLISMGSGLTDLGDIQIAYQVCMQQFILAGMLIVNADQPF